MRRDCRGPRPFSPGLVRQVSLHGRDARIAVELRPIFRSVNGPGIVRPGIVAGRATAFLNGRRRSSMSRSDQTVSSPGHWLANQPYLLLSITALCWAGNAIVG